MAQTSFGLDYFQPKIAAANPGAVYNPYALPVNNALTALGNIGAGVKAGAGAEGGTPSLASLGLTSPTGPNINISDLLPAMGASGAAGTVDPNAIAARYNPNAQVMGQFDANGNLINTQFNTAKETSNKNKDYAVGQVGQIDPMSKGIYDPIAAQLQSAAGGVGAGGNPILAHDVTALETAAGLSRAGFQQQAPLLSAGFNQINSQQLAQLGGMQASLTNQNDQARAGYLQELGNQKSAALTQADQFNASARAQASAQAAQAAQHVADTQINQRNQNFQNTVSLAGLQNTQAKAAATPVSQGGTLTPEAQVQQGVKQFFPDPNAGGMVDPARGYALAQLTGGDVDKELASFAPRAQESYHMIEDEFRKNGGDIQKAVAKVIKGSRADHVRAASLAMYHLGGMPSVYSSLSSLGQPLAAPAAG